MNNRSKIFPYIVALSALIVAGCAAYFSVYGISMLYAGAKWQVIAMAGGLELAKLVIASFLYRYWSELKLLFKIYLTVASIVLVGITSLGIYGFLTSAYQKTANKVASVESKKAIYEKKQETFILQIEGRNKKIDRLQEQISTKNGRIETLTQLRNGNETRLDSLYIKRWWKSINETRESIKRADNEIEELGDEIDKLEIGINDVVDEISSINDSIFSFDQKNIALDDSEIEAEIGPLKYLAELTGKPMDKIVNWFTLIIVFVFDPVAICLVLAANIGFVNTLGRKKEDEEDDTTVHDAVHDAVQVNDQDDVQVNDQEEPAEQLIEGPNVEGTGAPYLIESEEPVEEEAANETIEEVADETIEGAADEAIEEEDDGETTPEEYMDLLQALYISGDVKPGDKISKYEDFKEQVNSRRYTTHDVKRFLTLCNFLQISRLSDIAHESLTTYEEAKEKLKSYLEREKK